MNEIAKDQIVWIKGGVSHTGTDRAELRQDGEAPIRKTRLKPYGMYKTCISNQQFAHFVQNTGYVSEAHGYGWSFVFRGLLKHPSGPQPPGLPWWNAVEGATWDHPLGAQSTWEEFADHPVVHVSANDAAAYADWVGGRLPTEAEWEHAARGGSAAARYPWGDEEPDDETIFCNIWQGRFPEVNTTADGYYGTCPVDAFPPNRFGLFNMSGNVWEWGSEAFRVRSISKEAKLRNATSKAENERMMKGGSFLCHASYCWRYRIAARTGRQADNAASNIGFRLAFDPPKGADTRGFL